MYTNLTLTRETITENFTPAARVFIPWRAAGTLAMQALEQKIKRRFARVVTELVAEPVYGHNFDLPHSRHLVEQGYNHPENGHLEPVFGRSKTARGTSQMDGSHFRELCVQRGGANHALHLKTKSQLQPKTWLRAEYLAEAIGIPYDLAFQLVEAFKTLSIGDWKTARRIINGVEATGTIKTPFGTLQTGIAGKTLATGIKRAEDRIAAVQRVIALAEQLNEPLYEKDTPEQEVTELSQMYADSMTYGVEIVGGYFETDADDMADDDTPDPLVDDMLDPPGTDNAFGTHRLYGDGTDALPYEMELLIASADATMLKRLAQGMFTRRAEGGSDPEFSFTDEQRAFYRQITGITDRQIDLVEQYIRDPKGLPKGSRIPREVISRKAIRVPKRFWFFSQAQKNHFWALYTARKAEIAEEARSDRNFLRLLDFVGKAAKREAAAAIYAYRDRRKFDLFGIEEVLDGAQTPSAETISEAWEVYKKRFA